MVQKAQWVTGPAIYIFVFVSTGGLKVDAAQLAFWLQLLQPNFMAPVPCAEVPGMFMGNLNGTMAPQYAAFNGSEDKVRMTNLQWLHFSFSMRMGMASCMA